MDLMSSIHRKILRSHYFSVNKGDNYRGITPLKATLSNLSYTKNSTFTSSAISISKGTPLFMFNVTMQNHSSYTDVFDNFTPQIEVEGSDSVALNQYLSLLHESDKELQRLINYFDSVDDPTIIVFFGDHQPTDSVVSPIYKLNGKKVSDLSEEELRLRYQVPYLIHANFDIEEARNVPMSTNYLGIKTLETAGLPLTDYQQFLAEKYHEFPSVTVLQIVDSAGKIHDIDKKDIILNDYQILQYYHLFNE